MSFPDVAKSLTGWSPANQVNVDFADDLPNLSSIEVGDVRSNRLCKREISFERCDMVRIPVNCENDVEASLFESQRQAASTGE
jgi:hypothetical protein